MKHLHTFEEQSRTLSLEELNKKYPEIIFTMNKDSNNMYFPNVQIKTQGGKIEHLGALTRPTDEEDSIRFFNDVANKNYDKYY